MSPERRRKGREAFGRRPALTSASQRKPPQPFLYQLQQEVSLEFPLHLARKRFALLVRRSYNAIYQNTKENSVMLSLWLPLI